MKLAKQIKNYGVEIGLDDVKITDADNLDEVQKFLEQRRQEGQLSKFLKSDLDLITSPKQVLPTAESVIVVALSYYYEVEQERGPLSGELSQFAQGQDYHQVLGNKLEIGRAHV